jgi:aspartyl-tRNA(Asn)/glutamyl-tRNA(Gln) amidotransferase subunit B
VPLIEIVTEPDLRSAEEVEIFAEEFVLLIRHLGISSADAEKGQIRFEANVSLAPGESLGTKVEIKNINKIKSLVEAVKYEIERQKELILKGEKIVQETRGYDENKKITFSQRWKEEAEDYRYFPEPDLPPLIIDEEIEKNALYVETPGEIKMRFKKEYGLDYKFSQILVLEKERVYFFEETLSELRKLLSDPDLSLKLLINFFINDFIGFLEKYGLEIKRENITPHEFAHLLYLYSQNKISSKIVKEALELGIRGEMRVEDVIKEKEMISDAEVLDKIIEEVIKEFPQSVEDYIKGEEKALEFLIGQVMKKTKGRAEPNLTRQIILEKISHAK